MSKEAQSGNIIHFQWVFVFLKVVRKIKEPSAQKAEDGSCQESLNKKGIWERIISGQRCRGNGIKWHSSYLQLTKSLPSSLKKNIFSKCEGRVQLAKFLLYKHSLDLQQSMKDLLARWSCLYLYFELNGGRYRRTLAACSRP